MLKRILALFFIGAIGGAMCDQIHVRFGVLFYPEPFFLGQAWWVAPLFGIVANVIIAGAYLFLPRLAPEAWKPDAGRIITAIIWFAGAYLLSGLLFKYPVYLAALYFIFWIVRIVKTENRAAVIVFSILLALAGTIVEGLISLTGAFSYAFLAPFPIFHTPVWLPGLYLHGAPLALLVARKMKLI
ncbi:MAG: DUF2878 family protein [Deltaproteobacteria bacterium]|nr:DUF2878 family protein [Deltaproteobacteria bacterium]